MKYTIKTISISLIFCLCISFVSFGWNEGMSPVKNTSKEQVWRYYTGEEDENGYLFYLKNQWKQLWDNWYYFGEDGKSKQNTWAQIDGKWYYFDQWSIMLHDANTPDGYYVGSDGVWDQDGQAKVEETKPSSPNDVIVQKEAAKQQTNN